MRFREIHCILMWLGIALALCVAMPQVTWTAAKIWLDANHPNASCGSNKRSAIAVLYSSDPDHFAARLSTALDRSRDCLNEKIFLIGGARPHLDFYGAEEMAQYLQSRGIETFRFAIDRMSYSTATNVEALATMIEPHDFNQISIVADRLQLSRVLWHVRQQEISVSTILIAADPMNTLLLPYERFGYEAIAWIVDLSPEWFGEEVFKAIGRRI